MLKLERPPSKHMLVVLDLQKELVDMLTYRHGPVSRGIERVEGLLRFCKRLGIPIALVTSVNWSEIVPSILEAAGPGTPVFTKRRPSAFSDGGFARFVDEASPDDLIVGGSIRHLCAEKTVADAIGRGFGILSTDEILFGSADVDDPMAIAEALSFFSLNTRFFPDVCSIERYLGGRGPPMGKLSP